MKAFVVILYCTLFFTTAFGQTSAVPDNIRAASFLERLASHDGVSTSDILYGIPAPPGRVIGNNYLNTNWMESTIMLYESEKILEGYPVRYDIRRNELEVKGKNGVKVILGKAIKSFLWLDSVQGHPVYFVNAREYKSSEPINGFMEVIADGKLALLKHTYLYLRKSDYNVAMDVGSRDDKILKKEKYYVVRDGQLNEISISKKKLLPLFADKASAMEKYIDDNSLSLKNQNHLKQVFEYYQTL